MIFTGSRRLPEKTKAGDVKLINIVGLCLARSFVRHALNPVVIKRTVLM